MRAILSVASIVALAFSSPLLAAKIQPGEWEVSSQVTAIDMPGMTPQMLEMMKKSHRMRYCLTPEQAEKGPEELINQSDNQCKYSKLSMSGGKIDAIMQCNPGRGMAMTATMKGSFTPTSYDTTSDMVTDGPQGKISMTNVASGRLIGPCKK